MITKKCFTSIFFEIIYSFR